MHRLFGKPKPKVEAPTLADTSSGIGKRMTDCKLSSEEVYFSFLYEFRLVDAKIKALDDELRKYKEQLKKANASAAAQIKKRAMDVLKRKVSRSHGFSLSPLLTRMFFCRECMKHREIN